MIPDIYRAFIIKIIDKTNNGDAKWHTVRDKSFALKTANATVETGHYTDEDAELNYYYFTFFNLNSKKDAGFRVNNMEEDYPLMEKLFAVASASAANIGDELTTFLENL